MHPGLNIGALSRATGVPISTLRTWERRYGFPQARRTASNQRVYEPEMVEALRLVCRALDAGHRPAQVFALAPDRLDELSQRPETSQRGEIEPISHLFDGRATDTAQWIRSAKALDARSLLASFRLARAELGTVSFLERCAVPFLVEVGEAWARGELQTFHEHFASERLRDFLVDEWRPLSDSASGPQVICATLPGEHHVLGLHMAATVLALANCRVAFVGADTPLMDLRDSALQLEAKALFVGAYAGGGPAGTRANLVELRRLLPASIAIVAGGSGAPRDLLGIECLTNLGDIVQFIDRIR